MLNFQQVIIQTWILIRKLYIQVGDTQGTDLSQNAQSWITHVLTVLTQYVSSLHPSKWLQHYGSRPKVGSRGHFLWVATSFVELSEKFPFSIKFARVRKPSLACLWYRTPRSIFPRLRGCVHDICCLSRWYISMTKILNFDGKYFFWMGRQMAGYGHFVSPLSVADPARGVEGGVAPQKSEERGDGERSMHHFRFDPP